MNTNPSIQTTYDTIVIGAGQAGLAAGYHLAKRGKPFVILEADERLGGSWLHRWDSLRLFTPAMRNSLPGMKLGGGYTFPTSAELLDYFERYAAHFDLPVRTGVRVDGLFREGGRFRVTAGTEAYDARQRHPGHRRAPDPEGAGVRLRAVPGHRPGALGRLPQPGPAQAGHRADRRRGQLRRRDRGGHRPHAQDPAGGTQRRLPPDRDAGMAGQGELPPYLVDVGAHPDRGQEARPEGAGRGPRGPRRVPDPPEGEGPRRRRSRAHRPHRGVVDGSPVTEDGDVLDVANVIWCTGFKPDFGWVDLPGLDSSGRLDDRARRASSVSRGCTCSARSSSTCSTPTPSGASARTRRTSSSSSTSAHPPMVLDRSRPPRL